MDVREQGTRSANSVGRAASRSRPDQKRTSNTVLPGQRPELHDPYAAGGPLSRRERGRAVHAAGGVVEGRWACRAVLADVVARSGPSNDLV